MESKFVGAAHIARQTPASWTASLLHDKALQGHGKEPQLLGGIPRGLQDTAQRVDRILLLCLVHNRTLQIPLWTSIYYICSAEWIEWCAHLLYILLEKYFPHVQVAYWPVKNWQVQIISKFTLNSYLTGTQIVKWYQRYSRCRLLRQVEKQCVSDPLR